jgi:hypothetical protein
MTRAAAAKRRMGFMNFLLVCIKAVQRSAGRAP